MIDIMLLTAVRMVLMVMVATRGERKRKRGGGGVVSPPHIITKPHIKTRAPHT